MIERENPFNEGDDDSQPDEEIDESPCEVFSLHDLMQLVVDEMKGGREQ